MAVMVIFGFLSVQLVRTYMNNLSLADILENAKNELGALRTENQQLKDDLEYYSVPENLEKELKSKFDYKRPGETLIKIQ